VTDVALKNEAQLVSKADAALARGDHAGALAACDERAKSFPAGRMAEECEFTAIRALVGLGRASEARTRAESFRKRFPSSLYGAALNSMMGDASAP
jgi:outer membrane protein assembly factor BamD (BamD/ComL family)